VLRHANDVKGQAASGSNREGESTEAGRRGGAARSSGEACFSISVPKDDASAVSIVIFPGGSATNDYSGSITIRPDVIDWDAVYGKKYVFLHACVVYQTFGKVRHTSVCYYAQAGKTVGSLPFCDKGNRAD
jgi:hypothetical protein